MNGLTFGTGSSGSTVQDLAIAGFASGEGVDIQSGSTNDDVVGCWLGINASGTTNANGTGVEVTGSGATIGGTTTGDANVILGNSYYGVVIDAPAWSWVTTSARMRPAPPYRTRPALMSSARA